MPQIDVMKLYNFYLKHFSVWCLFIEVQGNNYSCLYASIIYVSNTLYLKQMSININEICQITRNVFGEYVKSLSFIFFISCKENQDVHVPA
jgi:hypothetical protein